MSGSTRHFVCSQEFATRNYGEIKVATCLEQQIGQKNKVEVYFEVGGSYAGD